MIIAYGLTHGGRRRSNEDAFLIHRALGLYAVADGMGGYGGGEVASRQVIHTLHRFFTQVGPSAEAGMRRRGPNGRTVAEDMIRMALRQADHEVQKRRSGPLREMGSTAAVLWMREGRVLSAHVGDSRIYRMRSGGIERLTRDHSLEQEVAESGDAARAREALGRPQAVTRAVGVPGVCNPDVRVDPVEAGDRYLLCTDGLSDVVPRYEIQTILRALDPRRACEALVGRAYDSGGEDNITVVVVGVESVETPR